MQIDSARSDSAQSRLFRKRQGTALSREESFGGPGVPMDGSPSPANQTLSTRSSCAVTCFLPGSDLRALRGAPHTGAAGQGGEGSRRGGQLAWMMLVTLTRTLRLLAARRRCSSAFLPAARCSAVRRKSAPAAARASAASRGGRIEGRLRRQRDWWARSHLGLRPLPLPFRFIFRSRFRFQFGLRFRLRLRWVVPP